MVNHVLTPARSLAAYVGAFLMTYIESSAFEKEDPFVIALPLIVLTILALITPMRPQTRLMTAISFMIYSIALSGSSSTHSSVTMICILSVVANLVYFSSFSCLIEVWSYPAVCLSALIFALVFLQIFSDLIVAIPLLVILLSASFASAMFLFTAALSVCLNGNHGEFDAKEASGIRVLGTTFNCLSQFFFLLHAFSHHSTSTHFYSKMTFYASQILLYLSNERTF